MLRCYVWAIFIASCLVSEPDPRTRRRRRVCNTYEFEVRGISAGWIWLVDDCVITFLPTKARVRAITTWRIWLTDQRLIQKLKRPLFNKLRYSPANLEQLESCYERDRSLRFHYPSIVSRGHTPFLKRGKGSGNLRCSRSLHRNFIYSHCASAKADNYLAKTDKAAACGFTVCFTLVISYWSCDNSTHVTEYCAVIGPHCTERCNKLL